MNDDRSIETEAAWRSRLYPARCLSCTTRMELNAVSHGCERWHCTACSEYYVRWVPKYGSQDPELRVGKGLEAYAVAQQDAFRRPDCDAQLAAHDHGKICQQRPIEVGDYVRWERTRSRDSWIEGELVRISSDGKSCIIKVDSFGPRLVGVTIGALQRCDGPMWKDSTSIRHIPRPESREDACRTCGAIPGLLDHAAECERRPAEAASVPPTYQNRAVFKPPLGQRGGFDRMETPCLTCGKAWSKHHGQCTIAYCEAESEWAKRIAAPPALVESLTSGGATTVTRSTVGLPRCTA